MHFQIAFFSLKVSFDAHPDVSKRFAAEKQSAFLWGEGRRLYRNVSPILCFAKLLVFKNLNFFSNLLNLKVLVGGFS